MMNSGHSEPNRIQFDLCSAEDDAERSKAGSKLPGEGRKSCLDPRLQTVLASQLGIHRIFPMQEALLSFILNQASIGRTGDVVLCAPTGSGKTLAYALPIIQDMLDRKIIRLRAIVVVPTRDLAAQVFSVFMALTEKFGISVLCIVGSSSTAEEARNVPKAEILIATPGRLVDHINNGDYLNLSDVRYLVLDESDRLLEDSYQEWIDVLIPALGKQKQTFKTGDAGPPMPHSSLGFINLAMRPDIFMRTQSSYAGLSQPNVRKILASATQTRNPMRLYKLGLRDVCVLEPAGAAGDRYSVPRTLAERGWVVQSAQQKPLALLQLLGWVPLSRARGGGGDTAIAQRGAKLVFANSVDSAHRLCRLLEICAHALRRNGTVLEMCGALSAQRRRCVLEAVRKGACAGADGDDGDDGNGAFVVVVCSDVLARGMDILTVDTVINYDSPAHISTYLHRAGRTARAGRKGSVFTLLVENQVRHFRGMVYEAARDNKKVRTIDMKVQMDDGATRALLTQSLAALRRVMDCERFGALAHDESVPRFLLYALNRRATSGASYAEEDEDEGGEQGGDDGIEQVEEAGERGEDTLHDVLFAQIGRSVARAGGGDDA